METLARQAEIGVCQTPSKSRTSVRLLDEGFDTVWYRRGLRARARLGVVAGRGRPSRRGSLGVLPPEKMLRLYVKNPAIRCIFGCNANHNACKLKTNSCASLNT